MKKNKKETQKICGVWIESHKTKTKPGSHWKFTKETEALIHPCTTPPPAMEVPKSVRILRNLRIVSEYFVFEPPGQPWTESQAYAALALKECEDCNFVRQRFVVNRRRRRVKL